MAAAVESLFDRARLKAAQPDLVLESFTSYAEWMRWIHDNRWAIDQSVIQQFVPNARANGISSLWLGKVAADRLAVLDKPPFEHVVVGGLTHIHRMLLDLVASMPKASDARNFRVFAAEAQSAWALAMRSRFPRFLGTEYRPEDPQALFPIQHQDLCRLTLPSEAFDLAVTIEILEHVPDLRAALGELARVLAPGGVMISTLPFLYFSEYGEQKARLVDGRVEHLVPAPEYHQDPHRPDGALVFQLPGWDLLDLARECGFARAQFVLYSTKVGCVGAPHLAGRWALVCEKGGAGGVTHVEEVPPAHGRRLTEAARPRRPSDIEYRAPVDLVVVPTSLRRVVVIGECLVEGWPAVFKKLSQGCESDYLVFNNLVELPDRPPAPPEAYDFQLVHIPLRSVIPENSYFRLSYRDVARYEALFEEACESLHRSLSAALKWNSEYGLLTFVANFLVPQQNPMGRHLPRYDLRNFCYFVEKLNEKLAEELKAYKNVYLFDFDQTVATFGRKYFQDDVVLQANHDAALSDGSSERDADRLEPAGRVTDYYPSRVHEYVQFACAELLAMYRTVRQLDPVKMVVVDIDDTLWRGVAVESPREPWEAVEGWPLGVVEALCYLKRRGVLLGLLSKNDETLLAPIWNEFIGQRLKFDDFAVRKINWQPKAENFAEMLEAVNLLPRNVVYIDDNPAERAAIAGAFPGVRTLGGSPLLWRRILLWSAETQVHQITAESANRTEMVQAQVAREGLRKRLSREEFLASLNLEIWLREVCDVDDDDFPRALELINKSNQFNTTGRRWTREEFAAALRDHVSLTVFRVSDRYTAYGTVGVVVLRGSHIVQFVMSCRVVGLGVEQAVVAEVLYAMQQRGAATATAELRETELNLLVRDLYERCGFTRSGDQWNRATLPGLKRPPHARLVWDEKQLR